MNDDDPQPEPACAHCDRPAPAAARYCPGCGHLLGTEELPEEERRPVTILFCDLVDSTGLSGRLDPEALRSVVLRYFDLTRRTVLTHGGTVEKFVGDAVMATFGLPKAREDDARRALATGLGILAALPRLNRRLLATHGIALRVRIGVHTGDVVAAPRSATGHGQLSGETANLAARLSGLAAPDRILAGGATLDAAGPGVRFRELGPVMLRGRPEPLPAVEIIGLDRADPRTGRRFDVPFLGRAAELAHLDWALRRVAAGRSARQLTIFGAPGVGRTRLITRWTATTAGARIGYGRCDPEDARGPYAPLADALDGLLAEHTRVPDADGPGRAAADLRRRLLGVVPGRRPSPGDLARSVADALATVSTEPVLVVVLEDCHLAESTLLDLMERLPAACAHLPLLLVHTARPELVDLRPGLHGDRLERCSLVLPELSARHARALARTLAAGYDLDDTTVADAVSVADGNPLVLELLLRRPAPSTARLRLLLTAWVDRLPVDQRMVCEYAAVVGDGFTAEALSRLAEAVGPPRRPVRDVLDDLVERRTFRLVPRRPDAFRFSGTVWREAVYRSTSKRTRLALHLAQADLLAAAHDPEGAARHRGLAHGYGAEIGEWADHPAEPVGTDGPRETGTGTPPDVIAAVLEISEEEQ